MIIRIHLASEVAHHTLGELWDLLVLDVWTLGALWSMKELRGSLKFLSKDIGPVLRLIHILSWWNVWSKQLSDSLLAFVIALNPLHLLLMERDVPDSANVIESLWLAHSALVLEG